MLETVVSYYCMQFQEKLIMLTQENGKKPDFGPDFDPLYPNSGHIFFKKSGLLVTNHVQVSSCLIPE